MDCHETSDPLLSIADLPPALRLHNFVHLPIFYKSSTLPLLNLYKEILYKVNNYSHVGNKVFPAWE